MTTINWTNVAGGEWYHQANWDLDRNPQPGDDVVIAVAGTYTVAVDPKPNGGGLITVKSLTISNSDVTVTLNDDTPTGISGPITNYGTVTFNMPSATVFGTFTNYGTLNTTSGIFEDPLINHGVLNAIGQTELSGNAPADILTSGVVSIEGHLAFDLPGSITSFGSQLDLFLQGTVTDSGLHGSNVFAGVTSNAGHLTLSLHSLGNAGVSFTNSGMMAAIDVPDLVTSFNFTNSSSLSIDSTSGQGGTVFSVGQALSNSGTLTIGNQDLTANDIATVGTLSNSGAIDLIGSTTNQAAIVDKSDAAPQNLTGSYSLSGKSLLQFASGGVESLAAGAVLAIDGSAAFIAYHGHTTKNSALTGLDSNTGTLVLGDGVVLGNAALAFTNTGTYTAFNHTLVKTNLDFSNGGNLNIDSGSGQGGSSLNVAGTFSNGGTFMFGNGALSAADLSVVTTLSNTGTIEIAGGSVSDAATLKVKGDATDSGTVDIEAFGSLTKAHSYTQSAGQTDVAGTINLPDTFIQGGILQGTGKVTSAVVVTGGAIAGGDFNAGTVGTLSIQGKLVDSAQVDATLVAVGSGSASDIDVSGNKVSLKGGTLDVHITDPGNLHAGEVFTVLTFTPNVLTFGFDHMTDGTHTGDGSSLDLDNGFTLDASYNNSQGDIQLTVVETPAHAAATDQVVPLEPDFGSTTHHWQGDDWLS